MRQGFDLRPLQCARARGLVRVLDARLELEDARPLWMSDVLDSAFLGLRRGNLGIKNAR